MFGFMKGKMEILIPRTGYAFGEIIEGTVTLELKKPQQAKGVSITLLEQETTHERRGNQTVPVTRTINSQTIILDSEKEYPSGKALDYPFKFTLPAYQGPQIDANSTLGKAVNVIETVGPIINALGPGYNNRTEWFLKAKLDVSGFDVNKDVKLQIRLPLGT
jgi:hypothetical protein